MTTKTSKRFKFLSWTKGQKIKTGTTYLKILLDDEEVMLDVSREDTVEMVKSVYMLLEAHPRKGEGKGAA